MSDQDHTRPHAGGPQDFATTHWSVVLAAGGGHQREEARAALGTLCEAYWLPLYAYARRRVADVAEAQDLTQAFFAELLEKNYLGSVSPDRGRFRAFLLTAFKHFLSKQWEKQRAQKRGGSRRPLSLDFASADSSLGIEPSSGLTPEQLYDRQWALAVLQHVMERLEEELVRAGKAVQFRELKGFLIGEHGDTTYALAARTLQITEAAARKAASRLRRRYRELLRGEIAQTVTRPEEVEDEIRNLFAAFEL